MTLSNVKKVPLAMGIELIIGDYTHTAGGSNGSIAVGAGRVYFVSVNPQSTTQSDTGAGKHSVSTSGAITTVTIYGDVTTTAGTFCILVGTGS